MHYYSGKRKVLCMERSKRDILKSELVALLAAGHTAVLEDVYKGNVLTSTLLHHYPQCRQCVKMKEEKDGQTARPATQPL